MKAKLNIVSFAVKNLRRKIVRTALLLLAVAVVTGTLFSATLFISSMQNALKIGTYRLGADVLIVPEKYEAQARSALLAGEPTSFYMKHDVLDQARKVEGVKAASPQVFVKPASFTCCYNVDVFLVAFEPGTDFTVTPWVEKHLKRPLGMNEVITGRDVPVITGDSLPFFGTIFKVVGTLEPTGMKFFDRSVFMTLDAAYKMAEDSKTKSMQPIDLPAKSISAVLVQVSEGFTPDRVAIRLEHEINGVKAIASDEVISTVRRQLSGILKGIYAVSGVLWVLALLMMGFAFSMMVNERQREIGVLRAMGAKKRHIFRLVVTEALMIAILGGLVGLSGGALLVASFRKLIIHSLKLPYLLPSLPVLTELVFGALIFSLFTGFLAVIVPAVTASRMEPYDAIRRGE
ncbi:MAG TPA: FtsX-like permease family protein [Thermodesulfovibrionales bacterium]|jgi:putative ABC transport system permease protein|nr:FtsX-like permease family protein [Thermodesulfovibrionales bacterium]